MRNSIANLFAGLSSVLFSVAAFANEHEAASPHGAHGGIPKVVMYQAINVAILIVIVVFFAGPKIKAFFTARYEEFMKQATEAARIKKELEDQKADLIRRTDKLRQTSVQSIESSKADAEKNFILEVEKARAAAVKMDKDASNLLNIDEQKLSEKLRLEALSMAVANAEDQLNSAASSVKGQFSTQFNQRVEGASV
jgi:F0F1-type ATP synthase membrane subunit b/b'